MMDMINNKEDQVNIDGAVCPIPLPNEDKIMMGHGSGGRMMQDLIKNIFHPAFKNELLDAGNDAAAADISQSVSIAIATDAHVVSPLFFPGGDIGKLAICGTVNDVAMLGAEVKYITASFILEEGFSIELLKEVVDSMRIAAKEAGVSVVAGDTKVVQKDKADGLYISTTGIGIHKVTKGKIDGRNAKPGDKVIISGTIGDHGIAVLSARGDLGFDADIKSDVAPLNNLISEIIEVSDTIHVLRDPTRGGLGTTLNEIATQSNVGIIIKDDAIPINPVVASACEMLGFDPLYVANEGKLVVIVSQEDADLVLETIQKHTYGSNAAIIGEVVAEPQSRVLMQTLLGSHRIIDVLNGEMLPRIC